MANASQADKEAAARTVAAIDVGANALRMVIAEVLPDGEIDPLERLHRAVRLGQDTFRRGRLGGESMRAAVSVLRDYRKLLDLYKVGRVRAVSTSAVREAVNADTFLDRVFMATGINLEVIAPSEESRLTVSAVHQAVEDVPEVHRGLSLIADVGGGSTLLTVLENGEITLSQSLRLGSIRLQEVLSTSEEPPERSAELLRHHISNAVSTLQGTLPLGEVKSFVATGGDARFAARLVGEATASEDIVAIDPAAFDKLVDRCERRSAEELAKQYGLSFAEAETLNPALLVYQILLQHTQAERMLVSHISMRDGLLLELARGVTGREDDAVLQGVIRSAVAMAEKYRIDLRHGKTVAAIAVRLFDEFQADHGLGARERLLLRVASLLHEIGSFVSNRSHHKHTYYLIANSEIFGLNRDEIEIVAQVARYHRRSPPQSSHIPYMSLPRERRMAVTKLAAFLRVADALDRGHVLLDARHIRLQRSGDELVMYVPGVKDLLLERRSLAVKGDMFEDVYGVKVRFEEA